MVVRRRQGYANYFPRVWLLRLDTRSRGSSTGFTHRGKTGSIFAATQAGNSPEYSLEGSVVGRADADRICRVVRIKWMAMSAIRPVADLAGR